MSACPAVCLLTFSLPGVSLVSFQSREKPRGCAGCNGKIRDRFMLQALDRYWHEDCLKCACCDCRLGRVGSTLYTRANLILCRRDYLRYGSHKRVLVTEWYHSIKRSNWSKWPTQTIKCPLFIAPDLLAPQWINEVDPNIFCQCCQNVSSHHISAVDRDFSAFSRVLQGYCSAVTVSKYEVVWRFKGSRAQTVLCSKHPQT